jgi:hypothetical protein
MKIHLFGINFQKRNTELLIKKDVPEGRSEIRKLSIKWVLINLLYF